MTCFEESLIVCTFICHVMIKEPAKVLSILVFGSLCSSADANPSDRFMRYFESISSK